MANEAKLARGSDSTASMQHWAILRRWHGEMRWGDDASQPQTLPAAGEAGDESVLVHTWGAAEALVWLRYVALCPCAPPRPRNVRAGNENPPPCGVSLPDAQLQAVAAGRWPTVAQLLLPFCAIAHVAGGGAEGNKGLAKQLASAGLCGLTLLQMPPADVAALLLRSMASAARLQRGSRVGAEPSGSRARLADTLPAEGPGAGVAAVAFSLAAYLIEIYLRSVYYRQELLRCNGRGLLQPWWLGWPHLSRSFINLQLPPACPSDICWASRRLSSNPPTARHRRPLAQLRCCQPRQHSCQ
eukprot:COSAG01_NODE_7276_length_3274_cov_1.740787_2_plen_299_part_00